MPKHGPCQDPTCDRVGQIRRGLCWKHHRDWQRHLATCADPSACGQLHPVPPPPTDGPTCAIDGCTRGGKLRRGWCSTHYWRWSRHGDPLGGNHHDGCDVDGCDEPHHARGLCDKHYSRAWYTGGDPTPHEHLRPPKIDSEGYRRVWAPDAPCAMVDGWALEHRLVMEQHIGRPLLADETVHHRNGTRSDNRLENLELWVSRHPKGQRVDEIVEWAVEMITRYRPDLLETK